MGESDQMRWLYQLTRTSESRKGRRVATPYGMAYELVGFDGNASGGLAPHPGFRFVKDLTGVAETGRNSQQTIVMFENVAFRVGASNSAWGFLYGVWDSGTQRLKVWLEYRLGASTTWLGPTLIREFTGVANADRLVYSRIEQGQFVFVFVEGKEPTLFYHNGVSLVVDEDTGPGGQPLLDSSTGIIATATTPAMFSEIGIFVAGDDALVQFNQPVGDEPAQARIHLVLFTGVDPYEDPFGVMVDTLQGPSDLSLWTVAPADQPDPTFALPDAAAIWNTGLGPLAGLSLAVGRPPSYYSFAYQLYDSTTGRKSQLSELASNSVGGEEGNPALAFNSQREYILFALLELVYDSSKYDQALVYRTVRGQGNAIYQLDQQIELATYEAADQTGLSGDWKRAFYFYTLIDPLLVSQPTFQGDILYDAEMPTAGAAILYEGLALMAKTGEFDPIRGGMGVVRWSNPYDVSLEQVAPENRYYLSAAVEDIIRFLKVGTNVVGYSITGLYHFRKENFFVKGTPLQNGYGAPGHRAGTAVGSEGWVVTEKGLKTVGDRGELTNVEAVDGIVQEWRGQLRTVELAYDSVSESLYVLNVTAKRAVVLWLGESVITELLDMDFKHANEGRVPYDFLNSNLDLQLRACFVQKVEPGGAGADPRWRVFVPDYSHAKSGYRFLDPTGMVRTSVTVQFTSGTTLFCANEIFDPAKRQERCKLYVMDGPLAGASATIRRVIDTDRVELEAEDAANLYGLAVGARVGISPVYARYTGYGLGLMQEKAQDPTVQMFDYARLKHAGSIACVFADVGGDAASDAASNDARFAAAVYKGNKTTFVGYPTRSFPVSTNGDKRRSVVDGPSVVAARINEAAGVQGSSLFPSVEIFVPDLTYTLLNVVVTGAYRDADTESFAATGPPA